jgi:hypothetical protein
MAALDASFVAYQRTTEVASTHTIARLVVHRILTLIRTGTEFSPYPIDPRDAIVESDVIDFRDTNGDVMSIEWREAEEALYIITNNGANEYLLLEGVIGQVDPDTGDPIPPFTLEFEKGYTLYRATVDLAIVPDDNMDVTLDGDNAEVIRLIASAMPRNEAFQ